MEPIVPLHHRKRGGCVIKKFREATKADAAGVVFLYVFIRKTTPASRSVDASRYFLNRSATPPCGDARRGLFAPFIFVHSFYERPEGFVQSLRASYLKKNRASVRIYTDKDLRDPFIDF